MVQISSARRNTYLDRILLILFASLLRWGINFFDTASVYGESEAILGEALQKVWRERFIVATKFSPISEGRITSPESVIKSVEQSLTKLRIDRIDLLQFHLVMPDLYRKATESLMPVVEKLRSAGKFRFLELLSRQAGTGIMKCSKWRLRTTYSTQ